MIDFKIIFYPIKKYKITNKNGAVLEVSLKKGDEFIGGSKGSFKINADGTCEELSSEHFSIEDYNRSLSGHK